MLWVIFSLIIGCLLVLDLFVFHRRSHAIKMKEAVYWSLFWVVLSLLFNLLIYFYLGPPAALQFFTGYLLEKSLSIDNIFIFVLIFSYFKVNPAYQHKILYWGVIGAIIMRLIFIFAGSALLQRFHGLIYLFGAFLVVTGIKLLLERGKKIHPEKSFLVRLKFFFPVAKENEGDALFVKKRKVWMATPLFLVLLAIESADLLFAIDSIPAIFAITTDPFIVYTSNIFAIMGLRSLYFVLAGLMDKFRTLQVGLSVILVLIGLKMLVSGFYPVSIATTLGAIVLILAVSVGWSAYTVKQR